MKGKPKFEIIMEEFPGSPVVGITVTAEGQGSIPDPGSKDSSHVAKQCEKFLRLIYDMLWELGRKPLNLLGMSWNLMLLIWWSSANLARVG